MANHGLELLSCYYLHLLSSDSKVRFYLWSCSTWRHCDGRNCGVSVQPSCQAKYLAQIMVCKATSYYVFWFWPVSWSWTLICQFGHHNKAWGRLVVKLRLCGCTSGSARLAPAMHLSSLHLTTALHQHHPGKLLCHSVGIVAPSYQLLFCIWSCPSIEGSRKYFVEVLCSHQNAYKELLVWCKCLGLAL